MISALTFRVIFEKSLSLFHLSQARVFDIRVVCFLTNSTYVYKSAQKLIFYSDGCVWMSQVGETSCVVFRIENYCILLSMLCSHLGRSQATFMWFQHYTFFLTSKTHLWGKRKFLFKIGISILSAQKHKNYW